MQARVCDCVAVQDADAVYLVQEHCEGGDLFKRLMLLGGRMDPRYVCAEVRPARACMPAACITPRCGDGRDAMARGVCFCMFLSLPSAKAGGAPQLPLAAYAH